MSETSSAELTEDELLRREFEERKKDMEQNPEKYQSYSTDVLEQLIPGQVSNFKKLAGYLFRSSFDVISTVIFNEVFLPVCLLNSVLKP